MQPKWWLIISIIAVFSLASVIASGCGIEQKRQRAGLQITAVEATAAAYLNGTYLNKTPLIEKNLRPGTYTVRLVADDTSLAPYEDQVTLRSGTLSTITWKPAIRTELASSVIYELESLTANLPFWRKWFATEEQKTTGDLKIVSIPDNAIITLEGQQDRQFAPFVFVGLPAGQIDYSVFLPSYETHQHTLDIKPGYRTTATITLAKNPPALGMSGQTTDDNPESPSAVDGAAASASGSATATSSATASTRAARAATPAATPSE